METPQVQAFLRSKSREMLIDDIKLIKYRKAGKTHILAISQSQNGRLGDDESHYGIVRLARSLESDEVIAFKELFKIQSPEHLKRELQITDKLGLLRTPLVTLPDGSQAFGMKLISGETVSDALVGAKTDQLKRKILIRSLRAIQELHRMNIAHGDMRTENIMETGQIIDFGLAHQLSSADDLKYIKDDFLVFLSKGWDGVAFFLTGDLRQDVNKLYKAIELSTSVKEVNDAVSNFLINA